MKIWGICTCTYPEFCSNKAIGWYLLEPIDETLPKIYLLFCPKHKLTQQQYANARTNEEMALPKEQRTYKTIDDLKEEQ